MYFALKSLNCVQLFVTPWTIACLNPLSMEFSRQKYWSGFPFPSPGYPSQPRDPIYVYFVSCIGGSILSHCATWRAFHGQYCRSKKLYKLYSYNSCIKRFKKLYKLQVSTKEHLISNFKEYFLSCLLPK